MSDFPASSPLLPEILALHGKWRGNKEAVIFGNDRRSWREFVAGNHRFANGLLARGLEPGQRVGIVMSNSSAMLQAIFGAMSAGMTSVPINLSTNEEGIAAMLRDAEIAALIVSEDQLQRVQAMEAQLPASLTLKVVAGRASDQWVTIDTLTTGQPDTAPDIELADDAEMNIIYSSGTTGLPKGIVHTQRGRRDWAYDLSIALRYHGGARTLLTLGLYSNISWVAMLCTALAGGTLVLHEGFAADAFVAAVAQEKITHTAMVPVAFQRVMEHIRHHGGDVASMQAMMSCGSPLHEPLKRDIFSTFPCGVIELYGLTEGIITTLDTEDAEGRWSSVGKPLIGTDICIINDANEQQPAGSSGEIVSSGRITMPGYLNREDANTEASYIDKNGKVWLRSGDIGYLDDDGFLYIVDRKKDMILSGGQNIYPQDIEALLVKHPQLRDVAVIGLPSKRWGETPVALVVTDEPNIEASALREWVNSQLGKQQRVADVVFVDELPRNPNGKILKRELRKTFGDKRYD